MYSINTKSIGEAHEKVVRLIMSCVDFNDVKTEDNELTFEYPEPVNIHIANPLSSPRSSPALKFGSLSLKEYADQLMTIRPLVDKPGEPDFSYLYSNLIFDYPKGDSFPVEYNGKFARMDWRFGNGNGRGKNQITAIIEKLSKNPTSRRAVITLFEPWAHPIMDDPPCLNHIQFMIRNKELNCHALFRSNDMLSAWGGNAYALAILQTTVLNLLNQNAKERGTELIGCGWLETTSISAHIYWKRDQSELDEFKKRWS